MEGYTLKEMQAENDSNPQATRKLMMQHLPHTFNSAAGNLIIRTTNGFGSRTPLNGSNKNSIGTSITGIPRMAAREGTTKV